MARRSRRAVLKADDERAELASGPSRAAEESADAHLVVFRLDNSSFAFRLDQVGEIIRVPRLAHMPLAPASLMGLANLRGVVLPVVSLRRLLRLADLPPDESARVVVIGGGNPVGFIVDRIEHLLALKAGEIESDDAGAGAVDPDLLDGVVKGGEGASTIKILRPQRLLRDEFAQLGVSSQRATATVTLSTSAATAVAAAAEHPEHLALVSFELGRQEYALPLDRVREIIPLPDQVSEVPRPETAVLGVVTLRNRLLPLVSLRALLGLPGDVHRSAQERGKVVVLTMGAGAVGVVADRTREILRVDAACIDPAPALLTRGAGDAEITSICRLDDGKRLVAVLSPDRLFRSDLARRVLSEHADDDSQNEPSGNIMADEQFIIFRLGGQEYGLPLEGVDEIARPPDRISRLPKAPAFIDGVMNLRGSVVPIVDLRRRFELQSREPGSAQRILVLAIGGGKTGFMVDSVSEVMRVPADAIRPAPQLSSEQMRLIGRVANLDQQGRMILLVDPVQLLDQVESDLLAKFHGSGIQPASSPS